MESPKVAPAPVAHTVTIKSVQGTCTVDPSDLKDVGLPDQVCFTNQTANPIVIDFFSSELFGTTSITVPPGSTACLHVGGRAQPGKAYEYSVNCLPAGEARPRIVIRSSSD